MFCNITKCFVTFCNVTASEHDPGQKHEYFRAFIPSHELFPNFFMIWYGFSLQHAPFYPHKPCIFGICRIWIFT